MKRRSEAGLAAYKSARHSRLEEYNDEPPSPFAVNLLPEKFSETEAVAAGRGGATAA